MTMQFAQWFGKWSSPTRAHFNYLAYSFLHGKLYIINPVTEGALTLFDGHWYVPGPPFPAILMLPFVEVLGLQTFNTTIFSVALAATTAVIVYLIQHRLIKSGWIKLSNSGAIWLTALFSFGSMYWFLSMDSRLWYMSQVVTVLFSALAFLSVLKKWSPWWTGFFLAGAVMSRPNVFVLWPALLAITIRINQGAIKKANWKEVARWAIKSAVPVVIGVGLLLAYNYFRYGSISDFEYGNINGSDWIIQNVQNYGLFSPHFIAFNLNIMLFGLPPLNSECGYFLTRGYGMSIFFTMPAIIYVFRRFKFSWWTLGSWISILLSIFLLSMYSNMGWQQYGFRYMMDFTIPIIMLIASNAGEKVSAGLKSLIIVSIFVNFYGTLSWFRGPC